MGKYNHRFFTDLGFSVGYASISDSEVFLDAEGTAIFGIGGIGGIGYNYNPSAGGFYLKVGPEILYNKDWVQIWGGISMGISF